MLLSLTAANGRAGRGVLGTAFQGLGSYPCDGHCRCPLAWAAGLSVVPGRGPAGVDKGDEHLNV